jgi:hypothetical protein
MTVRVDDPLVRQRLVHRAAAQVGLGSPTLDETVSRVLSRYGLIDEEGA